MRLEDIAVNLRVRNTYEAIDLGYAMTLAWRRDIFPVWASVYLAVGLVINLLCFAKPIVALFILWWLKPAFDRVILHVLAGAAFGAAPSMKATWRALPSLWRNNGLLFALTLGRFDLARSFNLPVTQLERQFGKAGRIRRGVLGREGRGAAVWLTAISAHFEVLILISIYLFIELFVPGVGNAFDPFAWMANEPTAASQYFSNAVTAISVIVLEPFFVAAGFALYLNTRTVLEGWDIELAFKRMNTRLDAENVASTRIAHWASATPSKQNATQNATQTATQSVAALVAVIGMVFISLPSETVWAEENKAVTNTSTDVPREIESPPATAKTSPITGAQARAQKILDDPEFGKTVTIWRIKYIGPGSEDKPQKPKRYPWLEKLGEFLGQALRILAWAVGIVAVIALFVFLIRQLERRQWRNWFSRKQSQPDMLFGLDVRPDSLPDDVASAARALLANGDRRGALSLLYRGALIYVIHDGKVEIMRGDTEGLCVRNVSRQYGGQAASLPQYFAELVNAWQRIAYAGLAASTNQAGTSAISADAIKRLIDEWTQYFRLPSTDGAKP
jgi:hypothetical protein